MGESCMKLNSWKSIYASWNITLMLSKGFQKFLVCIILYVQTWNSLHLGVFP